MSAKAFLIVNDINGDSILLDSGDKAVAVRQKFKHLALNPEKDFGELLYFDIYGKTLKKRFKKHYAAVEEVQEVEEAIEPIEDDEGFDDFDEPSEEETIEIVSSEEDESEIETKPNPHKRGRKGKR